MKVLKCFFVFSFLIGTMTSCLSGDDSYYSGFVVGKPANSVSANFANKTTDSLVFASYGKWSLDQNSTWCKVNTTSGSAYTVYSLLVNMEQNTTGSSRYADFRIVDSDRPTDAYTTVRYYQYATRGDGSLGNSALVKKVEGSDGSIINLCYDSYERPLTLTMSSSNGKFSRDISFDYYDYDSLMQVSVNKYTFTYNDTSYVLSNLVMYGKQVEIGQPLSLYTHREGSLVKTFAENSSRSSVVDSVCYGIFRSTLGVDIPTYNAFYVLHRSGNTQTAQSIYLNEINTDIFTPDVERNADSIGVSRLNPDMTKTYDVYKATYSDYDNRSISMDVNQLILCGVESCDPYLLLSLFRNARNTKILSSIAGKSSSKTVSATLSNKCVSTLTVTDSKEGSVTYTFTYY